MSVQQDIYRRATASTALRLLVLATGDSTTYRHQNGMGGAFANELANWLPVRGAIFGWNVQAGGGGTEEGTTRIARRQGGGATGGGTTTGLPAGCNGGIVCPASWDGWLPVYLATSADTIRGNSNHWLHLPGNGGFNYMGSVVGSFFVMEDSSTDAASGIVPQIIGAGTDDACASTAGSIQQGGTRVQTAAGGVSGTLRRIDIERRGISVSTATSGWLGVRVGTTYNGAAADDVVGPFVGLYIAATAKQQPTGFHVTRHISRGGQSLYDLIVAHVNTTNMANSVKHLFQCWISLGDTDYTGAWAAQGDVSAGGPGGNGAAYQGVEWLTCVGHNDTGETLNSFVPSAFPSWAVEASTNIVSVNVGAGTVDLTDATNFDSAGHIHVNDGEIITYTGKSSNQLTGCTFAAFGTTAGTRFGTVYQGYPSYTPAGFAANMKYWDEWLRARWAAAGGTAANFYHCWPRPLPVTDDLEVVVGVATANYGQREQRLREYFNAFNSYCAGSLTFCANFHGVLTAAEMVRHRLCDVNAASTLSANIATTGAATISVTGGMSGQTFGIVQVGSEAIKFPSKSGNNLTSCTRGAFGTTAQTNSIASHASGADIVELDMIHSSIQGYHEAWRRWLNAELGFSSSIFELEGM